MRLALQVINDLEREGLIGRHAIGGAMALLFHDEPVVTYDLDIFCVLLWPCWPGMRRSTGNA